MSELMHNAMLLGKIFLQSDLSVVLVCIHAMRCIKHLSSILFISTFLFFFQSSPEAIFFILLFMGKMEREKCHVREEDQSVSF